MGSAHRAESDLEQQLAALNERMRAALPGNLQELGVLIEGVAAADEVTRHAPLAELELSAHKLHGRAAMLELRALSRAAASLEAGARGAAPAAELSVRWQHCIEALGAAGAARSH